jgi:hypothetical protein
MSSLFARLDDRYFITTTAAHVFLAAGLITTLYLLTGEWVW